MWSLLHYSGLKYSNIFMHYIHHHKQIPTFYKRLLIATWSSSFLLVSSVSVMVTLPVSVAISVMSSISTPIPASTIPVPLSVSVSVSIMASAWAVVATDSSIWKPFQNFNNQNHPFVMAQRYTTSEKITHFYNLSATDKHLSKTRPARPNIFFQPSFYLQAYFW